MKKANLFKIIIVVYGLIMVGFVTSCKKDCKCEKEINQVVKEKKVTVFENNGRPKNMIKYTEIVKMLEAYDNTRKEVLKKTLGFEDTRVNTYPIQQLKDYIAYVEELSDNKGIELTGINIISAAYPKDKESKESGYQTLIFMPTTTIDGEQYVTFDPLKSKKRIPATFKSILAKKGYNWSYDNSKMLMYKKAKIDEELKEGNDDSSGANRLGSVPPY